MPRTQFRPCIDLHNGQVKQIVGGTLSDHTPSDLKTNFVSDKSAKCFAELYKENHLTGAHVIKLGNGNDTAAKEALSAWPNGLQIGGGITLENAQQWLDAGADKVIITSWLFPDSKFSLARLEQLVNKIGKKNIVIDVSCRKQGEKWIVAMNKWQTLTDMEVNQESLDMLSSYCSEFLIHAADVEGLCKGIDEELVKKLGEWVSIPTTYAGGGQSLQDLDLVQSLSNGKVDLTIGSALDVFGGTGVNFEDCVAWNKKNSSLAT